ncbi:eukaryotic translation initiation factor 4 gamma 2 isoform X1 [Leguminivora glycinivorella]|uniref:eukaryotic translation initiation factor 4 gamma 2 isoform X1 n=1 Tax=Leguminivora glycinivorella TaxID=1035111 RepID=UPI00200FD07E|nr:eukaryotic translation initiation factor 4 gamma 2 isoform X1 [Leguminivora glycinivorella]
MYAQLCKRLSEEAPNLEPPGQPCTFRLLLLNKCRAEFENRAQAFAAFEERALQPEEEERRHLAKCKMLGNIKFIGELGKLEILAESILHRCIQNLLARRAAADHHEDLECLAQLVRTCGRVLDSERGRGLMDQYFARIETLSHSRELQPRIRFMLRDVVELRRGGWVPRAATSHEGPVPIQQLRPDSSPPRRPEREQRDSLFRGGLRSRPLDDVLAGLALQPGTLVPPPDKLFGNGFPARDGFRQRSAPSAPQGYYHHQRHNYKQGRDQQGNGKEAPRLHKARLAAGGALEDVQMRPAAYSLMFTASANRLPKQPAPPPLLLPPAPQKTLAGGALIKEPAITIRPAPDKKDKPKKDKGLNKEEACRLLIDAATAAAAAAPEAGSGGEAGAGDDAALQQHMQRIQDAALPDKLLRRAIQALLEHTLALETESEAEWARLCAACMALVRGVKRSSAGEALRALPAGARLAALLAHAVRHKLLALAELGAWGEAGAPYPLLLDVLQRLQELVGSAQAAELYAESKLNLCAYVASGLGAAEDAPAVLAALEARALQHLVPALRVQAQLARQLQAEPAPAQLYRWIKGNVEPSVRQNAAFVSTLVALIAGHVTAAAGCVSASADKAALEREKALAEAYAPLLTALLQGRADLQLAAVYAVQLHAHHHRYPKGMLLRWFMYLYNLEVCEEDAFLRWREDVTDAYPGKGEALFQVNTWLTWLQQQESEDEEAED